MKNYRITVNGVEYEVSVEEIDEVTTGTDAGGSEPAMSRQKAAEKKPAEKKPAAAAGKEGRVKIQAPMPGKILAVKTQEGKTIKKGDVVVVLEAMKMENEIYSSADGVVASVNIASGDTVESGAVLITID